MSSSLVTAAFVPVPAAVSDAVCLACMLLQHILQQINARSCEILYLAWPLVHGESGLQQGGSKGSQKGQALLWSSTDWDSCQPCSN